MFKQLMEVVDELYARDRTTFTNCYASIFKQLTYNLDQNMNAILSVNCVYVSAIQRLKGPGIFAKVCVDLYAAFKEAHAQVKSGDIEQSSCKTKMKNILNCLLHFYLFKSTTPRLLIDLIKQLMTSFTETDIEILIFVLHNIGLQLRDEDPKSII